MSAIRNMTLGIAAIAAVGVLIAQENAEPPPPAASPPVAAPPPAAPAPAGETQSEAAPTAPPRAPVNDDEFIPTQELLPDQAVTFPVDI